MPVGAASTVSGRPISVLKFSRLAWTRPGSSAAAMSLTEVFPTDPVMPIVRAPSSRRQARARRPSASSGSRRRQHPAAALRRPARPRSPGSTTTPQAPAASAAAANSPPSNELAAQAEEEVPDPDLARVDLHPPGGAGLAAADDLGPDRGGDPLRVEGPHPASLRSSSRATSRSSKGILRPPSNSWPCSWPLPAITTVSPGPAAASASAIAARRSGSTSTPLPRRPRRGSRR